MHISPFPRTIPSPNASLRLAKVTAIASFVVGILALASLIAALAISGNAAGYLHDSLTSNVNDYGQSQNAIDVVDLIQTKYQCCGVNLWFDWGRVALGGNPIISKSMNNMRQIYALCQFPQITDVVVDNHRY